MGFVLSFVQCDIRRTVTTSMMELEFFQNLCRSVRVYLHIGVVVVAYENNYDFTDDIVALLAVAILSVL